MGKITNYTIVEGAIQIVSEEVKRMIDLGYSPYGQLLAYESYTTVAKKGEVEIRESEVKYYQAMVKEEEK